MTDYFDGRRERIEAFRAGDRRVLAELFHHYADQIALQLRHGFRLASGSVPGVADGDFEKDLVQEVFIRAFAEPARHAFNPLRLYWPYLLAIARNLLIDEARRRGSAPLAAVSTEELEQAPALVPGADEALHLGRLHAATAEYCASLSPELREFVRLRFETGLSQRDVADRLKVTRRRVRRLDDSARDGLKAFLAARGLGE